MQSSNNRWAVIDYTDTSDIVAKTRLTYSQAQRMRKSLVDRGRTIVAVVRDRT